MHSLLYLVQQTASDGIWRLCGSFSLQESFQVSLLENTIHVRKDFTKRKTETKTLQNSHMYKAGCVSSWQGLERMEAEAALSFPS